MNQAGMDKALRECAARHGYRVKRHGEKYRLMNENGERLLAETFADINALLDHKESMSAEEFEEAKRADLIKRCKRYSSNMEEIKLAIEALGFGDVDIVGAGNFGFSQTENGSILQTSIFTVEIREIVSGPGPERVKLRLLAGGEAA
jgi:hypothetical protein